MTSCTEFLTYSAHTFLLSAKEDESVLAHSVMLMMVNDFAFVLNDGKCLLTVYWFIVPQMPRWGVLRAEAWRADATHFFSLQTLVFCVGSLSIGDARKRHLAVATGFKNAVFWSRYNARVGRNRLASGIETEELCHMKTGWPRSAKKFGTVFSNFPPPFRQAAILKCLNWIEPSA